MNSELWKTENEWYTEWFDSEAYHALYGDRDDTEAGELVNKIHGKIGVGLKYILDAGCGAGRHVLAFAQLGYEASGFDLSKNSIDIARRRATEHGLNIDLNILDMRKLTEISKWEHKFDLVTNLFTSFGYFEKESEHQSVTKGLYNVIKPGGYLVLDYLNVSYSSERLVLNETIIKDDYVFKIKRRIHNGFFQKSISFTDLEGNHQTHIEQVRAWDVNELSNRLTDVGLEIESVYGNYELEEHTNNSPRCIIFARKLI